jgi:hypothetical protein
MKGTTCTSVKRSKLPSIKKIAETIGYPDTEDWKGRCFQIPKWLVDHDFIPGVAVYGHYLGDVAPFSYFSERYDSGVLFIRHGWISTPDKKIIDPTLWIFQDVDPYLYYGEGIFETRRRGKICVYDEGGNVWKQAIMRPCPPFERKGKMIDIVVSPQALDLINELLGETKYDRFEICFPQLIWLANLPLNAFGSHAKEIFRWIEKAGHKVYIPIDNWRQVMGDKLGK